MQSTMNGWELSWWPEIKNHSIQHAQLLCSLYLVNILQLCRYRIPLYKKFSVYMVIYHTNSVGMYHDGWWPLHKPTQWPRLSMYKWRGAVHYWCWQTPLNLFTFSFLTLIPNSFWSFAPQTHTYMHAQKEERGIPSHYIQNPHSMMEMTYKCVYLVARKPKNTHPPLTRTSAGVKGDESDGVRCASVKGDQSDGVRCEGVIGREDNSTKQPETA